MAQWDEAQKQAVRLRVSSFAGKMVVRALGDCGVGPLGKAVKRGLGV